MVKRKRLPKGQTKLFESEPTLTVKVEAAPMQKYCCPFCLYEGYLHEFQIPLKNGYSKKRAKCPDCGQSMRMDTLTKPMTPTELAKFLYEYILLGGYHKISWSKLKSRLKLMGAANTFWTAWRQVKDEVYRERYGLTYEEYLAAERAAEG